MLNDNQKPVTNNQPSQTGSLPPVPTDDMSPMVVEDTTPPMLNDNDLPVVNTPPAVTVEEKTSETDSGSAAPSDDVVMAPIVTTQKKKFAGGKVIATILGLFLLVGGLGAGIMLVGQDQNIQEKAGACGGGCGPNGQCAGDLDGDGDGDCVPRGTTDEEIEDAVQPGSGGLDNIGVFEPGNSTNDNELLPNSGTSDATQTWVQWQQQQTNQTGTCNLPSNLEFLCVIGVAFTENHPNLPAGYTRYCSPSTGRCSISGPGCPAGICGEYRIGTSTGGNNGGGGGGNNPTTPPTTPPTITASCQNLKAYPTSGSTSVPLTTAQLSALRSGDQFNLCVQGIKSGGSFDKVRFTINGVLQPEQAMVDRIGTTTEGQFCTVYTIPAVLPANKTFSFTAEMHHVTLGWR